jgi:hypothetical protein
MALACHLRASFFLCIFHARNINDDQARLPYQARITRCNTANVGGCIAACVRRKLRLYARAAARRESYLRVAIAQ